MPRHVLGLAAFYHDAAACLLRDGEIVLAIEEERLSRLKHDRSFPTRAIAACLDAAGIGPGDVETVVFYEKTLPKMERQLDTWLRAFPGSFSAFVRSMSRYLDGRMDLARWLEKKAGFRGDILFAEHHLSHAAFSFYTSPFERASVLVADGVGEWATTSLWSAGPDGIFPEREIHFPHSLGLFYSIITAHLGFRVNEDEYKVMGLAAYGRDTCADAMAKLLPFEPDGAFRLETSLLDLAGRATMTTPALLALLGPPRAPGSEVTARHQDIARSAQVRLEEALLRVVDTLPADRPLCLAGGVALNGSANARIVARRPLHVPFAPGDSGGAIGAAFVGHHLADGATPRTAPTHPYLGPSFSPERCRQAAAAQGLTARPLAEVGGDEGLCERLMQGQILGWFHGPMEFGPRALGHRSILADPRRAEMRDIINARIKHREPFRPFAPAILAERVGEFFQVDHPVPWMTEIHPIVPAHHATIAAVCHVDGTGRLQTVDAAVLPRLHALISAFAARTGVPVLLNTSFNVAGEPIVCTPEDACRCFLKADLDALVLEDVIISKE